MGATTPSTMTCSIMTCSVPIQIRNTCSILTQIRITRSLKTQIGITCNIMTCSILTCCSKTLRITILMVTVVYAHFCNQFHYADESVRKVLLCWESQNCWIVENNFIILEVLSPSWADNPDQPSTILQVDCKCLNRQDSLVYHSEGSKCFTCKTSPRDEC